MGGLRYLFFIAGILYSIFLVARYGRFKHMGSNHRVEKVKNLEAFRVRPKWLLKFRTDVFFGAG
jgi:hypothetical protein